jgi:LPXTG-motif cell wall-anchored protein
VTPPTTPPPFGSAIGPVVLTEDLPRTGTDTRDYVVGGIALLALGAGLTVAARKAASS